MGQYLEIKGGIMDGWKTIIVSLLIGCLIGVSSTWYWFSRGTKDSNVNGSAQRVEDSIESASGHNDAAINELSRAQQTIATLKSENAELREINGRITELIEQDQQRTITNTERVKRIQTILQDISKANGVQD